MNPTHWPRIMAAALALALAALATPTVNADTVDCAESGMFAVGGYPKPEQVPDQYTPIDTPGGIFPWQSGGYNKGQNVGAANLVAAVDAYAATCDGPILLRGHSYGAGIVHTALATIDQREYAPRVSVLLTGNPRRVGGIEDTWWFVRLPGMSFRGAGITPEHVAQFEDRCNEGRDIICHAPHPLDILGGLAGSIGYLTGSHVYP